MRALPILSGLIGALLTAGQAAAASPETQAVPRLEIIVRDFYGPYLNDAVATQVPDALDVLTPYATMRLRGLIARDKICEQRTDEVCDMDMDPIIGGQDWELNGKGPVVSLVQADAKSITLVARFRNCDLPMAIYYRFSLEAGTWRVDDLWREAKEPLDSWDLVTMLSEPD